MDPFHIRIARVALASAEPYGFCLAGGYAVQAHGFIDRRSDDVDLFTTMSSADRFPAAVKAVVDDLHADDMDVTITREGPSFARLSVGDRATGVSSRLELGIDWRAYPPAQLEIGPVLHPDDAVANKLCALYCRGELRDYIDVDGIIRSGRYTLARLVELAQQHDPGFDVSIFADALRGVERFAPAAFEPYELTDGDIQALTTRIKQAAADLGGPED